MDNVSYEYLPWRGVDKETMRFYDTKTKIDSAGKPVAIGYRYPNDSFKVRQFDSKIFHSTGDINKAGLFGRNRFAAGSNKVVTITEGELDALSLHQVLRNPVVSVRSSSSAVLDCTLDRSWLNSFERIYLAFDGDGPGRDAAAGVAKLFDFNKVYVVKFPGGNRKDANDYVKAGESDELRTIWTNSRKYQPDTIKSTFKEFEEILDRKPRFGTPWPWKTLQSMTHGIRTQESYLITALEGVGKTEICRAVEYEILKNTDAAVGIIFLEEPDDHHLRRLAGLELKAPVHLPDQPYSNGDILEAVQKVVRTDDRLCIYNHFGSDDPDVLLDIIRFLVSARSCRYIILDHISMVVSGLRSDKTTQTLDYLSTKLEMLLMELDFALIMVSHVNADGDTRNSKNIAKIANTRIDATRDIRAGSLDIDLTLSKNRFGYKTGPAGILRFDPQTWMLNEAADDEFTFESRVA